MWIFKFFFLILLDLICLAKYLINFKKYFFLAYGNYLFLLFLIQSIAQSIQEQQAAASLKRSESRSSLISVSSATSQEVERINSGDTLHYEHNRSRTGNSPADLHGMWYPPVRRTLVTLSRLYRCVERPIFQGLSQEALTMCVQSISQASNTISTQSVSVELYFVEDISWNY